MDTKMAVTERETYIRELRYKLAGLETSSLLACIRYVAANRSLTLCGSAQMYLDYKLAIECRGNIFYWLENDAPMAWLDWIADTENYYRAIRSHYQPITC